MMKRASAVLAVFLLAGCEPEPDEVIDLSPTHPDLPEHSECLPEGEVMTDDVCIAVVEHDGRVPTVNTNGAPGAADPNDPRLTDPDIRWLADEMRRCTCACCHQSSVGGPGVHRIDLDYEPLWIDSANEWTLFVFMGDTEEPDQTLPSSDPDRVRDVVQREIDRRRALD